MLRFVFFVLLLALIRGPAFAQISVSPAGSAAPSPSPPPASVNTTSAPTPEPISAEVAAAEAAIVASDWKTAEAKLDPYLAAHPADARALFDAGYVADAQNRLDDAAALYRRAIAANPKSFEAHISLGLLLARQNKLAEARPELVTATTLDPGLAGPTLKARAWRALARIDRDSDPAAASNDLLEALKLSPETPADTLLAAELAEQTGQNDAAEAAYRRVLLKDPNSSPANAGLAHLLILRKAISRGRDPPPRRARQKPRRPHTHRATGHRARRSGQGRGPPASPKAPRRPPRRPRHHAHVGRGPGRCRRLRRLRPALPPTPCRHPQRIPICSSPTARTLSIWASSIEAYAVFDKATQIDPPTSTAGAAWPLPPRNRPSRRHPARADHALKVPA